MMEKDFLHKIYTSVSFDYAIILFLYVYFVVIRKLETLSLVSFFQIVFAEPSFDTMD